MYFGTSYVTDSCTMRIDPGQVTSSTSDGKYNPDKHYLQPITTHPVADVTDAQLDQRLRSVEISRKEVIFTI